MRRNTQKPKGVVKGTLSGVVISILVHAVLFLLAGLLVVFTITHKEEMQFEPLQPVERPKMELKKPKVRVRKSAQPKATQRITAKVSQANLPAIDLPDIGSSMGEGFEGGMSAFDLMPDTDNMTMLGSGQSIGNDFEGVYYDLKFTRNGTYAPISVDEWRGLYYSFIKSDWDSRCFSKFYRSPKKLYATCFVLPPSVSALAPVAFGMGDEMSSGGLWIVHYKGKLVHKEDITFRFWVSVDDSLAIRVDDEIVLAASWISHVNGNRERELTMHGGMWHSSSADTAKYLVGHSMVTVGDWITLNAGEPKDMEVVATDNDYQNASFIVMVEVKGEEYEKGVHNGPLLPIFKTAELTHDHLDMIYENLAEGEADCVNGPVFRDY